MKRIFAIAAVILMTACQPVPQDTAPLSEPIAPLPPGGTLLEERQPDLCHAVDYVPYLGQPASVVPTLGLTRPYRVVEWRGIEPQEYQANRIVFRLDQYGNIFNIDCG